MLKATVSGSFHRHMVAIYEAVSSLREAGVDVLSPSDPRVVDFIGEFLFVASDKLRSVKLVQDRHLQAIRESDFLWVVCPDGYTGPSASMEIGAAYAMGVPIFSDRPATDITLGAYVRCVPSLRHALRIAAERAQNRRAPPLIPHVLIDPSESIERTHDALDRLKPFLLGRAGDRKGDAEVELNRAAGSFRGLLEGASSR